MEKTVEKLSEKWGKDAADSNSEQRVGEKANDKLDVLEIINENALSKKNKTKKLIDKNDCVNGKR